MQTYTRKLSDFVVFVFSLLFHLYVPIKLFQGLEKEYFSNFFFKMYIGNFQYILFNNISFLNLLSFFQFLSSLVTMRLFKNPLCRYCTLPWLSYGTTLVFL